MDCPLNFNEFRRLSLKFRDVKDLTGEWEVIKVVADEWCTNLRQYSSQIKLKYYILIDATNWLSSIF